MMHVLEIKNEYLNNLNHQINRKKIEQFKKNLPSFNEQLMECDMAVQELREKFEEIKRREAYKIMIQNLEQYVRNK
jgi:uncharacterized damage-inducible protein DinB